MLSSGIHIGRRGGVRLTGGGSVSGAYDAISSIVAAYGMRRLLGTYNGNLLRLRRSSDNAESDFGALGNGDLDTGAISAWLGANSGYVVTWYDQSGGARNATQATAAAQPLYVASGQNAKPVVRFDGTNDSLAASDAAMAFGANSSSATVVAKKSSAGFRFVFCYGGIGPTPPRTGRAIGGNANLQIVVFQGDLLTGTAWPAGFGVVTGQWLSATIYGFLNGVATSTPTVSSAFDTISNGGVLLIGARTGSVEFWHGDIAEIVIANAAWSDAQRQAAEAAANSYWAVY